MEIRKEVWVRTLLLIVMGCMLTAGLTTTVGATKTGTEIIEFVRGGVYPPEDVSVSLEFGGVDSRFGGVDSVFDPNSSDTKYYKYLNTEYGDIMAIKVKEFNYAGIDHIDLLFCNGSDINKIVNKFMNLKEGYKIYTNTLKPGKYGIIVRAKDSDDNVIRTMYSPHGDVYTKEVYVGMELVNVTSGNTTGENITGIRISSVGSYLDEVHLNTNQGHRIVDEGEIVPIDRNGTDYFVILGMGKGLPKSIYDSRHGHYYVVPTYLVVNDHRPTINVNVSDNIVEIGEKIVLDVSVNGANSFEWEITKYNTVASKEGLTHGKVVNESSINNISGKVVIDTGALFNDPEIGPYSETGINTIRITSMGARYDVFVDIREPKEDTKINFELGLKRGWNKISVPIQPDDASVTSVFGLKYVYKVIGSTLKKAYTIEPGVGYWVYSYKDRNVTITGAQPSKINLSIKVGWNLIGCGLDGLDLTEQGFYYSMGDEIKPGQATFVYVKEDMEVSL